MCHNKLLTCFSKICKYYVFDLPAYYFLVSPTHYIKSLHLFFVLFLLYILKKEINSNPTYTGKPKK